MANTVTQLNSIASFQNNNVIPLNPWLAVESVKQQETLSQAYQKICQKHKDKNKWILMVNPKSSSVKQLSHKNLSSNVLRIHSDKVKVNVDNLKVALSSGNCSAVILCDAVVNKSEIEQLVASAQQGKTKCILLNQH